MSRPSFICYGDSITQQGFANDGWVSRLSDAYITKVDVVNRGMSGYNTDWAVRQELFDSTFPHSIAPLLVILFFGANDATEPSCAQHVPLERYRANLEWMLDRLHEVHPKVRVLLVTPPPVHLRDRAAFARAKYGPEGRPTRTPERTGRYAQVARELAEGRSLGLVDCFSAMSELLDSTEMFHDGLHPNPKGNQIIAELVLKCIAERYPSLASEALEPAFEPWRVAGGVTDETIRQAMHKGIPPLTVMSDTEVTVYCIANDVWSSMASEIPRMMSNSKFFSLGKDLHGDVSLIIDSAYDCSFQFKAKTPGYVCVYFDGTMTFDLVGIIAGFSSLLAQNEISILAVATHHTDYVLVQKEHLEIAKAVSFENGWAWK